MRKMRKELQILIGFALILATIAGASATVINLTFDDANPYFKRINDDLVATWNGSEEIIYFNSTGIEKSINTSPYDAERFIKWGATAHPDTIYDPLDLFIINPETEELVGTDHSGSGVNTYNLSGLLPPTIYNNQIRLRTIVQPNNTLIMNVRSSSVGNAFWFAIEGFSTSRGLYSSGGCIEGGSWIGITLICPEIFVDYNGTGYNIYSGEFRQKAPDEALIMYRFHFDNSGTLTLEEMSSNPDWRAYGWKDYTSTYDPHPKFCYDDDDYIYCSRGRQAQSYIVMEKLNLSGVYGSVGTIVYSGGSIDALFADAQHTGSNALYVDSYGYLRLAIGATLTSLNISNSYREQFDHTVLDDAIIYKTGTYDYTFATFDEITNITAPPADNGTYSNASTVANHTFTDLQSLELIGGSEVVIGDDDELYIYDYTTPSSLSETDNVSIGDTIYKTSTFSSNIMVGTSEGIYTYDLATLTEQYNDKWGLFHPDKAYSVKTTSDTTAWVCDNNNEPDYYLVNNDPTGNLGTDCYDLEMDSTEQYLFIDTDDNGLLAMDVSNSSAPSITASVDETTGHGYNSGDLLSYYDDGDADLLLAITGVLEFKTYDLTSKSLFDIGITCNSAGAGTITSVELLSEEVAVAGTNNGRILFCDLTDDSPFTNTEWFTIEGMEGESVGAIEYDGSYIHAIGTTKYVIMDYTLENVTVNTPPNMTSYSVSDTTPDLDQSVVIEIVAGNVEPTDVIKYGVKCEGTETDYETNLEGSFTCEYNVSGTYYLKLAVTDNHHFPTFYDEKSIEMTVSETNFSGGIITVEVSDPTTSEYVVGAQVEADNESAVTNEYGRATLTVTEPISYATTITKTDYYTKVVSILANGDTNFIQLLPTASENQSDLLITITDDSDNPIEGALVSYTHTTSFEYDYTWTDLNGQATFADIDRGSVSVQASATNYDDQQRLVTLASYGTTTETIVLPLLSEVYLGSLHETRDCIDNGIWLCGESNIVEHSCTVDADCLSDRCTAGINRCSRFNYSVCDENDMARDQRCVTKFTAEAGLGGVTNFMLTNLLWIVVIIIILVGVGLVAISWNK